MSKVGRVNTNALASAIVLIGFGAFFGYTGRTLQTTVAGAMGPGYFPLVLAGLLVLLGLAIAAGGFRRRRADAPVVEAGRVPWRALMLLTAALVWFALAVRPLGLGPALSGALLLACLASRKSRLRSSLALSFGMTLFAWAVFIKALKLPVPLLGPWLF